MYTTIGERLKKLALLCLIVPTAAGMFYGIMRMLTIEIVYKSGIELADHPYIGEGILWIVGGILAGYVLYLLVSAYAEMVDKTIALESRSRELYNLLTQRLPEKDK